MSVHQLYNARLIDPASGFDGQGGVLIEAGRICDWGAALFQPDPRAQSVTDCEGHILAPGLVDLRVMTGEPGAEHRETLQSASRAAVAGGITSMLVLPDTWPVIDDMALVEFIHRRSRDTGVNRAYACGALTAGLKGDAIAELALMREAGAVAFSNADTPIANAGVMRRVMTYAASLDVPVFARADTPALSGRGVMHAGEFAARIGLTGMAQEAEWIAVARDLILAEATGAKVIIDLASTPRAIDLIAGAKANGVQVGVTVPAYSLFFNVLDVGDYLTYCKVNPPFRPEPDRLELIKAVAEGRIDAVVSAHNPQPAEAKRLPFAEAEFGAAGLETLLAAVLSLVHEHEVPLIDALRVVTSGPADLIGLDAGRLQTGAAADLVLIDIDKPWFCVREDLLSRSTNSPFDGRRLTGRAIRTWVGGERVFED